LPLPSKTIRQIPAKWDEILLVCRKCGKKLDGGFGDDGSVKLDKVLRKTLKERGRKGVEIVPVGCLDICPKNAVTVIKASAPGQVFIVSSGADAAQALDALEL
jgi:predicted metal-binding protein